MSFRQEDTWTNERSSIAFIHSQIDLLALVPSDDRLFLAVRELQQIEVNTAIVCYFWGTLQDY